MASDPQAGRVVRNLEQFIRVCAAPEIEAEYDALRKENERLRELLNWQPPAHYKHHDPKMTAGANCPACIESRQWRNRVADFLRGDK